MSVITGHTCATVNKTGHTSNRGRGRTYALSEADEKAPFTGIGVVSSAGYIYIGTYKNGIGGGGQGLYFYADGKSFARGHFERGVLHGTGWLVEYEGDTKTIIDLSCHSLFQSELRTTTAPTGRISTTSVDHVSKAP